METIDAQIADLAAQLETLKKNKVEALVKEYETLFTRLDQLTLELGDDVPKVMCKSGCGKETTVDWTCHRCE